MTVKISVVCCTARERPGFIELVVSLEQQTFQDFELIYCDKLHLVRGMEYLKVLNASKLPHFQYIEDDSEQGFVAISSARNKAIAAARGEIIVCIDDLTTFYPDSLQKHCDVFDLGWDANAAFSDFQHAGVFQDKEPDKVDARDSVLGAGHGQFAAHHFYGYHCAFSKKAWLKVNGYDEAFDGAYGWEDVDFGLRLFNAGAAIRLSPDIRVNQVRDEDHGEIAEPSSMPCALDGGLLKWRNDRHRRLGLMNTDRVRANHGIDVSEVR